MQPKAQKALKKLEDKLNISISSDDLDSTDWGKSLVEEFGRVTAEKMIVFLNRNGYSHKVSVLMSDIIFKENPEVSLVFRKENKWCLLVDDKKQLGINSIQIPKLHTQNPKSGRDIKLEITYSVNSFRTDNPFTGDSQLDDFDFDTAAKAIYHIKRMKIDKRLRNTLMSETIQNMAHDQGLYEVNVDKVIDILEQM